MTALPSPTSSSVEAPPDPTDHNMSERLPDNISSTSDAPPPDPSGPGPASSAKSPESVVDMEAEDIAEPTIDVPAPPEINQMSTTAHATAPIAVQPVSSDDADGRKIQLEEQELVIGGGLNAELYAELLLIYLVQQKRIDAKFCFMRAVEKFENVTLRNIWKTGRYTYEYDFANALKEARQLNVGDQLQHYVNELKNRLLSIQLKLVAKCYQSIEFDEVANLLAMDKNSEAELRALIATCGWTIEPDGFVIPSETQQLQETSKNLVNRLYGAMDIPKKEAPGEFYEKKRDNYVDKLKTIVSFSDFFDNH